MPDIIQDTPAVGSPAAPPAANVPADDAPLSAHVEAFHPETLEERTDGTAKQTPQERKRHRAPKDLARAEDVPRIRELSGKVKDLERERDEWKAKASAAPPAMAEKPVASATPEPRAVVEPFNKPRPKLEDFATEEDPYEAKLLATARWEREKERFEEQQANQQRQSTEAIARQQAEQQAQFQQQTAAFAGRVQAFMADHPDYADTIAAIKDEQPPDLLMAAILADDNGPAFVYHLAQRPDDRLTAHLLTDGKPVSQQLVASTQHWLRTRVQTGTTGAVARASTPIQPAPRPPTPVRTTPMPPTDEPPGDNSSLRDHQKFFHKTR